MSSGRRFDAKSHPPLSINLSSLRLGLYPEGSKKILGGGQGEEREKKYHTPTGAWEVIIHDHSLEWI